VADPDAALPRPGLSVGDIDLQQIPPSTRTGTYRLPPDIDDFTGRHEALRRLQDLLAPSGRGAPAVVVSAAAGQAGVGKTALATRVAHRLEPAFPDGQLYVDLQGADRQGQEAGDVLAELLLELGVPRAAIPGRLDLRAARYRAELQDRRVLVVLDNASGEAQVRPLLPVTPGSAALITSRARLEGLEGVPTIVLDALEPAQAVELLAKVVGPERVAAEPEAAARIVELCGRLPLAIRIAGARLAAGGPAPLTVLADRLAGEHGRLVELKLRDMEVRASFALHYPDLREDERHTLRLLSLLKAPDFAAWVAAALLDREPAEAETLIGRLVDAEMLEVAQTAAETADGQVRYRFHDLLRLLARERLWDEEQPAVQESALHRVLRASAGLAGRAAGQLQHGSGQAAAVAWFTAERLSLIAMVEQAYDNRLWRLTWELAADLVRFLELLTHWTDWEHTQRLALHAARHARDREAAAAAMRSLGDVLTRLGRFEEAVAQLEQALALSRALGDRHGEASGLVGLAGVHRDRGQPRAALRRLAQAEPIFRELGDDRGRTEVLLHKGHVLREQGRYKAACPLLEACLTAFTGLQDHAGEAWTRFNLGMTYQAQGRLDEAAAELDRCRALFAGLGDRRGAAWTSLGFGHVELARGGERALATFERAAAALREIGDRLGQAKALQGAGLALAARGDRDAAEATWREASAILRRLGASESTRVDTWHGR
jgi:tetratricopeptide (TPR) repeat protein